MGTTIGECRTCKHSFTTGKDRWYCKKSLADKDDCREYEMSIKSLEQQPCKDAVSRTAVLNTLDFVDKALDENRTIEEYKELLRECYEQLPPVTPAEKVERWIPVSERLPEESGRYLAYIINKHDNKLQYIMTAYFFSDSIFSNPWAVDDESASDNVVAWMPLPEPYKAERSGEE